jgi:phosphoglycerate dehydrogenase-like enzyme
VSGIVKPEHVVASLRPLLHPRIRLTVGAAMADSPRVLVAGFPSLSMLRELVAQAKHQTEWTPSLVIPFAGIPAATAAAVKTVRDEGHALSVHSVHANFRAVAEFSVGLALALMRRIVEGDMRMRNGLWLPSYRDPASTETESLVGKRIVILGFGNIGRALARRLWAFEVASIRGTRASVKSVSTEPDGVIVHPSADTPELLKEADVLFVVLPQAPSTTGLLGEKELALLHPHALLINVGRGAVIDEAALFNALKSRSIAGAAVDVWYRYPTDATPAPFSDHPFHELDNVVLTPHCAARTHEAESQRWIQLAKLLNPLAEDSCAKLANEAREL